MATDSVMEIESEMVRQTGILMWIVAEAHH
jgi:hypothetical protein